MWKFVNLSHDYWNTKQNQRTYLDWLGSQLQVKQHEDWYNVSLIQAKEVGGWPLSRMLHSYNGSLTTGIKYQQIY
jgi:hypothetical protein